MSLSSDVKEGQAMQLIASDILEAAHGLSPAFGAAGLTVGVLLWITGWWGHRFWIVMATTVTAGVLGIVHSNVLGTINGMRPLVTGVLVAIAAGLLALALARVIVFAAGGAVAYLVVHAVAPANWDEPLGWFLIGGMVGLLLFRLSTMALTSFTGSLLAIYSLLCLLDRLGRLDAIALSENKRVLLNAACLTATVVGVIVQILIERRQKNNERWKEERMRQMAEREQEIMYGSRRSWFGWRQPRRAA